MLKRKFKHVEVVFMFGKKNIKNIVFVIVVLFFLLFAWHRFSSEPTTGNEAHKSTVDSLGRIAEQQREASGRIAESRKLSIDVVQRIERSEKTSTCIGESIAKLRTDLQTDAKLIRECQRIVRELQQGNET